MKKSALMKTSLREIKNSPTRFLSIMGIIFLGVAFFVGIGATGPDMIQSADAYYTKYELADLSVLSSLGVSEEDVAALKNINEVDRVEPQHFLDVNITEQNVVIRFLGYQKEQTLNNYLVNEGRLPEKSGEIALDLASKENGSYQLGDTLTVSKSDSENQLTQEEYKIVGFVSSPEYIETMTRGNTTVGNGSIDFFAVIPDEDISLDAYTRILVSFNNLQCVTAYSDTYEETLASNMKKVEAAFSQRPQQRLAEIKDAAQSKLSEAAAEVKQGEEALADAKRQLDAAQEELNQNQALLQQQKMEFDQKISAAEAELAQNEATLNQKQTELTQQEQQLTEKAKLLAEQKQQLEQQSEQLAEGTNQKQQLQTAYQQLEAATAGYQQLLASIEEINTLEETAQTTAIQQAKLGWSETLKQLMAPAELQGLVDDLPTDATAQNLIPLATGVQSLLPTITYQQQTTLANLEQITGQEMALAQAQEQLNAAQSQLEAGQRTLSAAKEQIASGFEQLHAGQSELAEQKASGQSQLDEASAQLAQGEAEYQQGLKEYTEKEQAAKPQLAQAKAELKKQQQQLDELAPAEYYFNDRTSNSGYSEYHENANRISSLATVFPIIFFLIAALVSLTTMSRMVEEKRSEIGTFKALGYRNHEIAVKFLIYATAAGVIGSILGLALGFYLFPTIIINAYGQLYNIREFSTPWQGNFASIAILVSLLCTVGIALIILRIDLLDTPAKLLRPKAPKAGKRILLERIRPLWRRLNFNQKVTMRNLFRYKARMLMTIFGIAGCTSLILTGFGLRDSVGDMVPIQFEKLWHYQAVVAFDGSENIDDESYQQSLTQLPKYQDALPVSMETFTLTGTGHSGQDVTVYVAQDPDKINEFILFNDRVTKKTYSLNDEGAIINEKLAKLFDISVGDTVTLKNSDNQSFSLKVAAIVENYVGHFAYVTPSFYQKTFDKTPSYNAELLLFKEDLTKEDEKAIAKKLMEEDGVINVSFLSDSLDALDDTTKTLNLVVWVLIISAGLLAFIVLYNLNNINISERIRELSTIKVLGFYNKEVTMYIYRENIFLTIFGVIFGLLLGILEHAYVLQTVEVDLIMFSPVIHWQSYAYASLITVLFAIIVGFVMYFKLRKVDMIEALKSNE